MDQVVGDVNTETLSARSKQTAKFQVEREKKYARYVITVDKKGNPIAFEENKKPQINVLAVIGPAQVGNVFLRETILLEIGRNRSYPYRKTYGLKNGSKPKVISDRIRYATLSNSQLKNAFPKISEILIADMRRRTQNWEFKDTGYKTRSLFKGDKNPQRVVEIGTRYSVSHFDKAMLTSILRSELAKRPVPIEKDLEGASHYIRSILNVFPAGEPTKKDFEKFLEKRRMVHLFDWFSRRGFHPHHYYHLLRDLKGSNVYGLFLGILEYLKVDIEQAEEWGALLEKEDAPIFQNVQLYLPSNKWTENKKYRKRYKKFVFTKSKPTYLVFQLQDIPVPF